MAHLTRWDIDQRLVYGKLYHHVMLDEVATFTEKMEDYTQRGQPLVHFILDLSEINQYPPLMELRHVARPFDQSRIGWTLIVTNNRLLKFLTSTLFQRVQARFRFVNDVEAARTFIHQHDASLNP